MLTPAMAATRMPIYPVRLGDELAVIVERAIADLHEQGR